MAVRALSTFPASIAKARDRVTYSWAGLTQATLDNGALALVARQDTNLVVTATGTFGAGGTVVLEGSDESPTGPFATLASMTNTTPQNVGRWFKFVRPRVTAGDGTTSLTVTVTGAFQA